VAGGALAERRRRLKTIDRLCDRDVVCGAGCAFFPRREAVAR
jgi:hypothetical protein